MAPLLRDDGSNGSDRLDRNTSAALRACISFVHDENESATTTKTVTTASSASSHRSSNHAPENDDGGILRRTTDAVPSHWPTLLLDPDDDSVDDARLGSRRRVHFPPGPSIVTAVRTRPRTHILDVSALHYGDREIRKFKREYKREKRKNGQDDGSLGIKVIAGMISILWGTWDPSNVDENSDSNDEGYDVITAALATASSAAAAKTSPPSSITVTDACEAAREALSRLNTNNYGGIHTAASSSSFSMADAQWDGEETNDTAPSHWIHCSSFNAM